MPYSGPFQAGDRVQLTDAKRRHFTIILEPGTTYHTHRGQIAHDDIMAPMRALLSTPPWALITCASVTSWLITC